MLKCLSLAITHTPSDIHLLDVAVLISVRNILDPPAIKLVLLLSGGYTQLLSDRSYRDSPDPSAFRKKSRNFGICK